MNIDKNELIEIVQTVVDTTIKTLVDKGLLGSANANDTSANANSKKANANLEKTAYQRTEQLLFNYNNFKKVVRQKEQEIEEIRKYGVCEQGSAVVQYGGSCGSKPRGIMLDEERVEAAIKNVQKSMESTVQAIALIDKSMATLNFDPYYKILEMRYFEGRTQEDIAMEFNCTQQNIAYHKSRLIKELSIKIFPDKVIGEYLN